MQAWAGQTGFNWADWAIVTLVAVSALISLVRGFVKEALSLLVWVLAFVIAFFFSEKLAPQLAGLVEVPSLRYLAAFALLFVCSLVVGSLITYLVSQLVKMTGLSPVDRLLGVMFGLSRGVLIALLVLIFVPKAIPVQQDDWWQRSQLIPRVLVLENWSRRMAAELTGWGKEQLEQKEQWVDKVQQQRDLRGAP